ncbi:ROK family glucokinase [Lentibacillus sp. CBA3610]|uniref:ROK family glucokinase n=1 Tax=Lentibacillus sp. CBA3610 TaxID=2518176 RepID=UPI0015959CD3|nr:ROK family glucokinase [Lentibacillus sp. CBA3610]QKY69453.1 ROK family glucokinase [Lentibacillus sp. CBA3610]
MGKSIIGVDVGGTTVKLGIIANDGTVMDKWQIPTNKDNHGASIISDIWNSIKENTDTEAIKGIGVGAPGFIDSNAGYVYEAVNIGWRNKALADELRSISGLPVFTANDANVAALGENWKGAGSNARNLVALTLGTGVGGGIIVNGDILDGENGTAGEIGHTTVAPDGYLCNCGRKGCLETLASATGMVRQAMDKMEQDPESALARRYKLNGAITTKDIFELAEADDESCSDIIAYTADVLGLAIANAAAIINPSKILIGGGLSKAGDKFIRRIEDAFREYSLTRASDICELKTAQLGNDAGIIGAAYLVKQYIEDLTF